MKYRVRHATEYSYANPVDLAAHLIHLSPRPLPYQRVIRAKIESEPTPVRATDGTDHFGNLTNWLFLDRPHAHFDVVLDASVDVDVPPPPEDDATPPW
jgi:transglutaminase-like putative cysteine protease